MVEEEWRSYEEIAARILNQFASEFGIDRVEGKQGIEGEDTTWEIDAKGIRNTDGTFLIVECKRYTRNRVSQETVGGLAYRILDTGASGGIIVSPLGLQTGAKKVAAGNNIFEVRMPVDCTPQNFQIQVLNKFFIGMSCFMSITGSGVVVHQKPSGEVDRIKLNE